MSPLAAGKTSAGKIDSVTVWHMNFNRGSSMADKEGAARFALCNCFDVDSLGRIHNPEDSSVTGLNLFHWNRHGHLVFL